MVGQCSRRVGQSSIAVHDHIWTVGAEEASNWSTWTGKPLLISEWYVKGEDSGMPNISGAGWLVKTQEDRGKFYQNFALALLAHQGIVGWQWFRYLDNDPADPTTDPSNLDSNKGFFSNTYLPYEPLLDKAQAIHEQAYRLIDYFDQH